MEIIRNEDVQICWACDGKGCSTCNNTGKWIETTYYHIIEKNGKKYAIDGDTIK